MRNWAITIAMVTVALVGTFALIFNGHPTGLINWSANPATLRGNIQAALDALPAIGLGNRDLGISIAQGASAAAIGGFKRTFAFNSAA